MQKHLGQLAERWPLTETKLAVILEKVRPVLPLMPNASPLKTHQYLKEVYEPFDQGRPRRQINHCVVQFITPLMVLIEFFYFAQLYNQ